MCSCGRKAPASYKIANPQLAFRAPQQGGNKRKVVRHLYLSRIVTENLHVTNQNERIDLSKFAWLSVIAAALTISLKTGAYLLTGSVGLLSDAAESVVNLVAAIVAVVALRQAAKPADHKYSFGRSKAEYFSSTVEGAMIFIAAGFIIVSAIGRILRPAAVDNLSVGLLVSVVASALNAVVALVLLRAGKQHRSPALISDAKHLFTDVLTSTGVLVGVGLVALTGKNVLDPIVALLVGLNILVTGHRLLRGSIAGLMDVTLDDEQNAALVEVLARRTNDEVQFHGLHTRAAGQASFASVHMLVPGSWPVKWSHELAHQVAEELAATVPGLHADIHVEPLEDPASYADIPAGSLEITVPSRE